MKTRIIITAIMAVLLSSTNVAMAGNTVDAYQRNSSNNLTITQSGTSPSSIAIDQNGYDTATINQSGATNTIEVVQDQSSVTTPQTVNITQDPTSSGNVANVYQTTTAHTGGVGTGLNTGGTALENSATIFQYGASSSATITQTGNTNSGVSISQDNNSVATISQAGTGNVQAIIDQTSGAISADSNNASITQDGTAGSASIVQSTNNNTATIIQDVGSSGLVAAVTQQGQFNIATVTQSVASHSVTVTQDGDGLGAGTENTITITQDGLGGSSDIATAIQHTGESNQIIINQHRGDGSVVNVTQDGAANIATITQN